MYVYTYSIYIKNIDMIYIEERGRGNFPPNKKKPVVFHHLGLRYGALKRESAPRSLLDMTMTSGKLVVIDFVGVFFVNLCFNYLCT